MVTRRTFSAIALLGYLAGFLPVAGAGVTDLDLKMSVESAPGAATQVMLAAFRDALKEELGDVVAIEYFDGGTLGDEIVHMEMVRSGQVDVIPIGSDAVQLDAKMGGLRHAVPDPRPRGRRQHPRRRDRPAAHPVDARQRRPAGAGLWRDRLSQHHQQRPAGGHARGPARAETTHAGQQDPDPRGTRFRTTCRSRATLHADHAGDEGARWDGLSDEHKAAIERAARAAVEHSREYGANNDATLLDELSRSMEVNEIDLEAFQEAARPIWDEIAPIAGEEFTKQVVDAASRGASAGPRLV